jgi:hypothetical protein
MSSISLKPLLKFLIFKRFYSKCYSNKTRIKIIRKSKTIKIYYQSLDYKYFSYYFALSRNLCFRASFTSALVVGSGSRSRFIKSIASADILIYLGNVNYEN